MSPMNQPSRAFRIKIYPEKCIGAGHCVGCAPEIFSQNDDDGVVILLAENPPPGSYEGAKSAASLCPTSAIEIIEH
jgi:ferredoxin